jgi:Protein of unknown function, DUF547
MSYRSTFITFAGALVLSAISAIASTGANAEESVGEVLAYNTALTITYGDYETLLGNIILVSGPSTRRPAPRPVPQAGTRIIFGNRADTRFEANRVMFHLLTDENRHQINQMLHSIESVPGEKALANFRPDERLAFWLNLRNLTVLDAIAEEYPIGRLRDFWQDLRQEKRLTVAGVAMSIADIEAHVKSTWRSPFVIYGFYNGTIGGPNLRNRAFTGDNVWDYLRRNGREFVSSLRGVQYYDETIKVSTLYEIHSDLFPNFEVDLRDHLMDAANPIMGERIWAGERIVASVSDWYIADLYNGTAISTTAAMTGPAALLNSGATCGCAAAINAVIRVGIKEIAVQAYPEHVREYLRNWVARNSDRRGFVTVEDVDNDTTVIVPDDDDDQDAQQH